MPDCTAEIINYDPMYDPLPPSVEDLISYENELIDEGNEITFEWATNEIKQHMMNWVRAGLVAIRACQYKLYKGRFKNWGKYCVSALGKTTWQIKRMMNGAQVVMILIRQGFSTVPNCISQAGELARQFGFDKPIPQIEALPEKLDKLVEFWKKVTETFPPHLITQNLMMKELGHEPKKGQIRIERNTKEELEAIAIDNQVSVNEVIKDLLEEHQSGVTLNRETAHRLARVAAKRGISIDELIAEMFPENHEEEQEDENLEESEQNCTQISVVAPEKLQAWEEDLEQIVKEHEHKIGFLAILTKLLPKPKKSQFYFLREIKEKPSNNNGINFLDGFQLI